MSGMQFDEVPFMLDWSETTALPEGTVLIVNPRFDSDGKLDVEATAKASVRINNIGVPEK